MERLLSSTVNATILTLTGLAAAATLLLAYLGVSDLFCGQSATGGCALFAALAPAVASFKLYGCRNGLAGR